MPRRRIVGALLIAVTAVVSLVPSERVAASAAGSRCMDGGVGASNFGDRLALTFFYYWYDPADRDDQRLATRPPSDAPFDWRDPAWHREQLADMAFVGIDVALAVYWGDVPSWSTGGLAMMVAAREALLAEGAHPPALGLFLDTNLYSLLLPDNPALNDLTSDEGLDAMVAQIMGFFDRVPACHWAKIGGRPLIFLWRADTEDGDVIIFDQAAIDSLYDRLEDRLGARPYIVRERTWDLSAGEAGTTAQTDAVFRWGSALRGTLFDGSIVSVGPGYDDRQMPDRPGYFRDRDEGRRFADDMRAAAASGADWLLLETWNELWEGTAIAETQEHGRAYLEIARRYTNLFHSLDSQRARDGWVDLFTRESSFLHLLADAGQERGEPDEAKGRWGVRPLIETSDGAAYLHLARQPGLGYLAGTPVSVTVEYFDEGSGQFCLEYDSLDADSADEGRFKATTTVEFRGSGEWLSHRFELPDARFERRQYAGYGDFRIRDVPGADEPSHLFRTVQISVEPGERPVLVSPENLHVVNPAAERALSFRWQAIAGVDGYAVQVVPSQVQATSPEGPHGERYLRCGGERRWAGGPTLIVAWESACQLSVPSSTSAGLYGWRVWATTLDGERVGQPSDWAYFAIER